MTLQLDFINQLLSRFSSYGIIPSSAYDHLESMTSTYFIFSKQLAAADSLHLHIKVESTDKLPHEHLAACGGSAANQKNGYIKYTFENGVNLIFSSIPVTEEESAGVSRYTFPHLDHIGIDMSKDNEETYAVFSEIPAIANGSLLPVRRQGGNGNDVHCCHVQVNEKYWVYPPGRPYLEFAFGPLIVNKDKFGCDLRPADPGVQLPASSKPCC